MDNENSRTTPDTAAGADRRNGRIILQATDLVMDYTAPVAPPGRRDASAPTAPTVGRTLALDGVSFTLHQGESVAIMGPSGSGKSTLLHVLAGIIAPTCGVVRYMGHDLGDMPDAERTALRRGEFGFVFQSGQLLPELPAVENVALPMMLAGLSYGEALAQARQWLNVFGLGTLADQRPGELSGGQRQRVAIARALGVRPQVVFADEPTGALDRHTGNEVMGILTEAGRRNGCAVVLVTHDPSMAAYCSHTVFMQDGRLYDHEPEVIS